MITGLALIIIFGVILIICLFLVVIDDYNVSSGIFYLSLLCFVLGIFLYFDIPKMFPDTFPKLNAKSDTNIPK